MAEDDLPGCADLGLPLLVARRGLIIVVVVITRGAQANAEAEAEG